MCCWKPPPSRTARSARRWRPPSSIAADQTFKDVIGDAISKRDAIDAWIERAGSVDKAIGELSQRLSASIPMTRRNRRAGILLAFADPGGGMAGADRNPRKRLQIRRQSYCRARRRAQRLRPRRASTIISKCSAPPNSRRAKISSPRRSPNSIPTGSARLHRRTGPRLRSARRASARLAARERTRALVTIAADVIARYAAREGPPRAARLRRPDRQDAGAVRALVGRLGALQARSRHRPRADRRGAGHQPEAMGDRAHHRLRIHPGRRAAERRRTVFAVGDEKQSIFSFQGAAPRAFDEMRREFAGQFDRPELGWRYLRFHHSFRSGENVLGSRRPGVRAREISSPASPPTKPACRRTCRCPTPRPGWSSCGR